MIELNGLHLLLTYQCNYECDHCFVWGSPWQHGTMALADIIHILLQAKEIGTIDWIYFEGGEPFLFYPILLTGAREAHKSGFRVGIVSNAYWAITYQDALEWLQPLESIVQELSLSGDLYHGDEPQMQRVENALAAATFYDIPANVISIMTSSQRGDSNVRGQLPPGESPIMFRGRAAEKLAGNSKQQPWQTFTNCPYEDLKNPGRLHLDPLGNLHICQGIVIGNIFQQSLAEICAGFEPDNHPMTGPLLTAGPVGLVEKYKTTPSGNYADACHLCYSTRKTLWHRSPEVLAPAQMYGVPD